MPAPLPLHELHQRAGATFGERWGWSLPLHYGDVTAEHEALRAGAGVIDRSMLGKVTVTGRDRQAFLQGMLTNDVKGLAPGHGTEPAFLDPPANVIAPLPAYTPNN